MTDIEASRAEIAPNEQRPKKLVMLSPVDVLPGRQQDGRWLEELRRERSEVKRTIRTQRRRIDWPRGANLQLEKGVTAEMAREFQYRITIGYCDSTGKTAVIQNCVPARFETLNTVLA